MTWNVSIAIRSLCVTLLAAILALVLVVTLAEDADARRVRRAKGVADFRFSKTFDVHRMPSLCSPAPRLGTVDTAADWDPRPDGHQSPLMATDARPWATSQWARRTDST